MRSTSPIIVALSLTAWCLATRTDGVEVCVKCHVKPAENSTDHRVFDMDQWEVEEGQKRSAIKLIARSIEFIKTDGRGFEDNENQDEDIPI